MDLRNAGFKLAPVDTNLFPGGFNNLNPAFLPLCVQAAQTAIEKICPEAKNLLLIPENHTRNQFYLMNVAHLATILRHTGLNVRIGSLLPEITAPTTIELPDGQTLTLEPLRCGPSGRRLGLEDFDPCSMLLNNDLSAGVPEILRDLHEQFVIPPLHAGWVRGASRATSPPTTRWRRPLRRSSASTPGSINPEFEVCGKINFHERTRRGVPGGERR